MNEKREQATTQWGSSFDGTKFYMVYAEGKEAPAKKHLRLEDAKAEARRISEKEGVRCYVMNVCAEIRKPAEVEQHKPKKLYWFQITDDTELNRLLLEKMIELAGDLYQDDLERDKAVAPNICFNMGDEFKVWNGNTEGAGLIKTIGTELRVKEK